jgi:hypothetical protein
MNRETGPFIEDLPIKRINEIALADLGTLVGKKAGAKRWIDSGPPSVSTEILAKALRFPEVRGSACGTWRRAQLTINGARTIIGRAEIKVSPAKLQALLHRRRSEFCFEPVPWAPPHSNRGEIAK